LGEIELGHAKCLLALNGSQQVNAGREVAASSMTVRQTEVLVKKIQLGTSEKAAAKPYAVDPDIIRAQEELSKKKLALRY